MKITKTLSGFFRSVFGVWTPPAWVEALGQKISSFKLRHPKVLPIVAIALAVLVIAGGSLTWWYTHLPVPEYVTVTVVAPTQTTVVNDQVRIQPLVFKFEKSVAQLDQVGKVIDQGIKVSSAVEGTWMWDDDKTLFFRPKQDWAADQTYEVSFDRKLFSDQIHLRTYSFDVTTFSFGITVPKFEFYQDPTDPKNKRLVGTVQFTHPVDAKSFEQQVSLMRVGDDQSKLNHTVKYDKYQRVAYVMSENVEPADTDKFVKLIIAAGVKPKVGTKTTTDAVEQQATIPSIENFFRVGSFSSTIVTNPETELPEQILVITTTDGAQSEDIAKNIDIYLLPKDLPATADQDVTKNYAWSSPEEVTDEIFGKLSKIDAELIPSEKKFSRSHTFRFKQTPGRYLYVYLNNELTSFGGYKMPLSYHEVVQVPEYPKEIQIMHDGSLLTLQGERKLSLMMRGVGAVQIKFNRIIPEQINQLISQTEGDFTNPDFSYNCYDFDEQNISEIFTQTEAFPDQQDPASPVYRVVDFSKYLTAQHGLFLLEVREWDPVTQEPLEVSDRRFVLVTDTGIVAKKNADASYQVFAQSIMTGSAIAGAAVDVIGKNGMPVVSAITDESGQVAFGELTDYENEKKPIAFVVRKGADLSFLPYDEYNRQLELSRFDVEGVFLEGQDQLKAYVFSDRGIYRPGETIQAGVIVRSTKFDEELESVPLEVEVKDVRGLVIQRSKLSLSPEGFFDISYKTDPSSPTGTYAISVYLVKLDQEKKEEKTFIGSTAVRVEEFLPDQMKITARFSSDDVKGWVKPDQLKGLVDLANLYGKPATNRLVKAKLELTPTFPSFSAFADYTFFNPAKLEKKIEEDLVDQLTNDAGNATFDFDLGRFALATYRLSFAAEGYSTNEGGRSVKTNNSVLVSPFPSLVGFKPDGDLDMLHKDSAHKVHLVAVDQALNQVAAEGLKQKVVEKKYVSTLVQQSDETYKYQSVLKEIVLSEKDFTVPADGVMVPLSTDKPGDFEIRLTQVDGTKACVVAYSVAGSANLARSMEKAAELKLTLDKDEYLPGEEIEISIKAPYAGAGLITIERDHVYATQWFRTDTNSTVQKISVPDDFEGNGYVNVAFARSVKSNEIFVSSLSYGVVPFTVSLEHRTVDVTLDAPMLVEPGQKMTVKYSADQPAKIVLFGVDEGILQFAGYPTPDPLSDFFAKRALEVTTYQTLDLILPEYSVVRKLFSPAGDQGYKYIGNNLNPFKRKTNPPVIFWSGIIDVDETEQEYTFNVHVPDYFFGAMRVMAVAVAAEGLGVAEKKTTVRGPFVINPTAPLFVAPGDVFDVGLVVANNVKGSGPQASVLIEAQGDASLEIVGEKKQTIVIGEDKEQSLVFKFKTLDKLGDASLKFIARLNNQESHSSISLSVRPAVAYATTIKAGSFKSGKTTVAIDRTLYPNFAKQEVGLSSVPLILSQGLVRFLIEFPYGCTEQLVSQALPAVLLKDTTEFGYDPQKINTAWAETLRKLRTRQNGDGSFNYWPVGESDQSDISDLSDESDESDAEEEEWQDLSLVETEAFLTIYVYDLLQEAKRQGLVVPTDMMANVKDFLKKTLRTNIATVQDAKLYAYATYLLTRDGIVTSDYLANLTEYLDGNVEGWNKTILGPYVAATYKLLQKENEADELLKKFSLADLKEVNVIDYYDDSFIDQAQYISLLSQHFPQRLQTFISDDVLLVFDEIIKGRFNTIRSAYAVKALRAYSDAASFNKPQNLKVQETTKDGKTLDVKLTSDLFARGSFTDKAQELILSASADMPLFYQVTQAGFDRGVPENEIKSNLEVYREFTDDQGKPLTDITLGTDIFVHLKLRSLDSKPLHRLVIVDLLPGGFEKTDDPYTGSLDYSYVDAREDRVLVFCSASTSVQEFVYKVKAVSQGEFTVPPPFAESMYDQRVRARGKSGKVVVE